MNLTWITFTPIQTHNKTLYSDLASARYRVIIPAQTLKKNHNIQFICVSADATELPSEFNLEQTDTLIFSKTANPLNEQLAKQAKAANCRILFDVCDNHYTHPQLADHYLNMSQLADHITVSTHAMAEQVAYHTKRTATLISDPFEGLKQTPRFSPQSNHLKLLWFGHPSNLNSLQAIIPELHQFSTQIPLTLHIVSAPNCGIKQACQQLNQQQTRLQLHFSAWSLKTTFAALKKTDIVIIPSLNNAEKQVKSPNRLIEALWAGKYVIAHPLPSYQPFKQWTWLGESLSEGLAWALANKKQVPKYISQAQTYIAKHHAPSVIGQQWEKLLLDLNA